MLSAAPASIAAGAWPADGLERVERCPACGATARSLLHANLSDENSNCAPGRWTLWRCSRCGTAYLDPRPTRSTIALAYRTYYTHDGRGHEELSRLGALVFATLPGGAEANSLLDVGSGTGFLVRRARELGWSAEGLDPDDAAVRVARSQGLPVRHATVDSVAPGSHDVITMNHVIEHMHDPIDALRACRRALRPGGSLWLATPNIGSLGHRALRTAWYGLDPPRHVAVFSERGLAAALDAAGFARVEWRPSVSLAEAPARVRRVLRHRRLAAQARPHGGGPGRDLGSRPDQPRVGLRIARHGATHALLRAAELALPRTADELLVRAWPEP